jgi:hypothetical protein
MKKSCRNKKIIKKRKLEHYANKPLFQEKLIFCFQDFFGQPFFGHLFLSIFESAKIVLKIGKMQTFWWSRDIIYFYNFCYHVW